MCEIKKIWFTLFIIIPFGANAQIISTIAGGGAGGNGSPAISASIFDPSYLAFDKNGNLYFSENLSNVVRKIDTFGIISTIAGTGGAGFSGDGGLATNAQLNQPNGIAVDSLGDVFIADAQNKRVRKVTIATGVINTIVGSSSVGGFSGDGGPASSAVLTTATCICFDHAGNLYVGDAYRIRKINSSGIINTIGGNGLSGHAGDGGPATAAACYAFDMTVDNNGNLYVAEYSNLTVRRINVSGIITTVAGDTSSYMYNGDEIPATSANMVPVCIAFNLIGELFISDYNNNRVRMVDLSGVIHTVVGNGVGGNNGDGGPATAAEINFPSGLAFDRCGNLFFGQVNSSRIRKVTFNSTPCTGLAANTILEKEPKIYPNPVDDILIVDNVDYQVTYYLVNIVGSVVQQGSLMAYENSISIKTLPPGMYFLELTDGERKKQTVKFIKK